MLGDCKPIGHAAGGDVVGDRPRSLTLLSLGGPVRRHGRRVGQIALEQAPHDRVGLFAHPPDVRMSVHMGEQKRLDVAVGRFDFGGMANEGSARGGDPLWTVDPQCGDPPPALADRVLDEASDDAPGQFVNDARLFEPRMQVVDLAEQDFDERNGGANCGEREQAGAQAVIDVVGVISDVVGERGRLRLQACVQAEIERLQPIVAKDRSWNAARPLVARRGRAGSVKQRPVVFDEAGQRAGCVRLSHIKGGVAALEFGDDAAAGMAVVLEASVLAHAGVECVFAGVPERRVAQVVAEGDPFREGRRRASALEVASPACDLRHLDCVSEAGAEMIAVVIDEHLGLVREAAEGCRMDDAVAVALEFRAGVADGVLGDQAPRRARGISGVGCASRLPGFVRCSVP